MIVEEESVKDMKFIKNKVSSDLSNFVSYSSQNCLSDNISSLNNLDELEVSNNEISEVPQSISFLCNLKTLNIHRSALKLLPETIGELQNLHTLILNHNKLKEVPDSLSNLRNLEVLDFSHNELENLPLSYSKLQRLKHLNISNNRFTILPKCIEIGMGTLKTIDISKNINVKINVIPYSKYLEKFYAKENNFCSNFPDWLLTSKFFNIKEFNFGKTKFFAFHFVENKQILHIKSVSMDCSNISSPILEKLIENLASLEKLNVGNESSSIEGNGFNKIPIEVFKNPKTIKELNFRATGLSTIPSNIDLLSNLQILDIGLNCLSWLPDEFCNLQNLKSLIIDGNGLIMLPKNIGNLKSLEYLRAENNYLARLPDSFKNLKKLKFIDMYNNMFEEFPDILFEMNNLQGLDFEQNFFDANNIKIEQISYPTLRKRYFTYLEKNSEIIREKHLGFKKPTSIKSESSANSKLSEFCYSSIESVNEISNCKNDIEENWDLRSDSDDEFEPNRNVFIAKSQNSIQFIPPEPNRFCPADLHAKRIKAEVTSMRVNGSLPSYGAEDGQFDDA